MRGCCRRWLLRFLVRGCWCGQPARTAAARRASDRTVRRFSRASSVTARQPPRACQARPGLHVITSPPAMVSELRDLRAAALRHCSRVDTMTKAEIDEIRDSFQQWPDPYATWATCRLRPAALSAAVGRW